MLYRVIRIAYEKPSQLIPLAGHRTGLADVAQPSRLRVRGAPAPLIASSAAEPWAKIWPLPFHAQKRHRAGALQKLPQVERLATPRSVLECGGPAPLSIAP